MIETKAKRYVTKIASCIEKNLSFTVPSEDGTKYLCGDKDDWNKLEKIVRQILEDKE